MEWKGRHRCNVAQLNREVNKSVVRDLARDEHVEGLKQLQFAQAHLNGNFLGRRCTEVLRIRFVFNRTAGISAQTCIPHHEPQEDMRIEEQLHSCGSVYSRKSSSGASKSSPT